MTPSKPYLRPADDGTFELLVPVDGIAGPHILPYSFRSEADAATWIASRKGRERIREVRARYERQASRLRSASSAGRVADPVRVV